MTVTTGVRYGLDVDFDYIYTSVFLSWIMSITLACYHKLGRASAYYISAPLISKFKESSNVYYHLNMFIILYAKF